MTTPDSNSSDGLFDYDEKLLPMDPERQEKLSHLKKAIQTGTYNEEQWLNELLHNMSSGLEDSRESKPDTPPD